jgi:hypothetical protein
MTSVVPTKPRFAGININGTRMFQEAHIQAHVAMIFFTTWANKLLTNLAQIDAENN